MYSKMTWNAVAFNPVNVIVAYIPVKYNPYFNQGGRIMPT